MLDLLDTTDGFRGAVRQIVDDDRCMTRRDQLDECVGADVASAAGDKYIHVAHSIANLSLDHR